MTFPARRHGLALATLCCLAAAAPAGADTTVRSESFEIPAAELATITLEVPVGEVRVLATRGSAVEVAFALRCDGDRRCRERAADMRLERTTTGRTLELEVEGYPDGVSGDKPEVRLEVRLPARLAVELELGVGEVEVEGMTGDIEVETGVGEVRLLLPAAAVASVAVEAGIGEVEIDAPSRAVHHDGFLAFGREATWQGSGESVVRVEVGVGEARVELDGAGSRGI